MDFGVAGVALFLARGTRPAKAQNYEGYRGCMQQFYERNQYGWLAFKNTCSDGLSVTFATPNLPGCGAR